MPRIIHHFRQETDLFTKQKLRTYKFLSIITFKIPTIRVYLPKNEAAKAREHEFPFGTFRLGNLFGRAVCMVLKSFHWNDLKSRV